jgi:hypothetical protein
MISQRVVLAEKDDLLPLRQLAPFIPGTPSYWTLLKWIEKGATSKSGKIVKMECKKLPSGKAASRRMYDDFVKNLNA